MHEEQPASRHRIAEGAHANTVKAMNEKSLYSMWDNDQLHSVRAGAKDETPTAARSLGRTSPPTKGNPFVRTVSDVFLDGAFYNVGRFIAGVVIGAFERMSSNSP